jgi:hypothetical protein
MNRAKRAKIGMAPCINIISPSVFLALRVSRAQAEPSSLFAYTSLALCASRSIIMFQSRQESPESTEMKGGDEEREYVSDC